MIEAASTSRHASQSLHATRYRSVTPAGTIGTGTISRAFGNRNVADINPARTDPGCGWSPVAMDRPAQAGAPIGRHRRGASELLFLFSNHYGTPDQRGSDSRSLAHQPVSRAIHNGLREAGDGHACSYAPLPRSTHGGQRCRKSRAPNTSDRMGSGLQQLLSGQARQGRAALPEQQRSPVVPRRL
jgi:hypothetical protein